MRYVLESPLRRPWHVLVPTVLVLIAVVAVGLLRAPRYRAAALVLGAWEAAGEAELQSRGIDVAERRIREVRERVLDGTTLAQLHGRKELQSSEGASTPAGIEEWSRVVRVVPEGATAYRIECVMSDAIQAALVANLLASELVGPRGAGEEATERLNDQVAGALRRIEQSKAALRRFRDRSAAPGAGTAAAGKAPDDPWLSEMHDVTLALAAARARAAELRAAGEASGSPAGGATSQKQQELQQVRITLLRLRERYTDEHPDVERLVARVKELEEAAARERQGGLPAVQAEIVTLTARLATLMRGSSSGSRTTGPRSAGEAQELLSEYEAAVGAYQALLERSESAEAAARLGRAPSGRFELLRSAPVPEAPESRGLALVALLGGALGLLLGGVTASVAELRDDTVRGPEDLAGLGHLLLATIPLVRSRASRSGS